jgi:glutathione synthase/RimK-type ligase-like ATP-grasp enzyme
MTRYNELALVTCAAYPELYADERELVPAFARAGVQARAVVWSDPSVPWSRFDRVVLRSTWDYFERIDEFLAWLDRLEQLGVPLVNSPSLVRWNLDKRYLPWLAARGVAIAPTELIAAEQRCDLVRLMRERGWTRAVVKPAVSGGAYRTHRVSLDDAAALQPEVDAILRGSALLVQPFLDEIVREGEWSFVFLDGELSHAVLKRPAPDDFRVQPQFGGTFARVTPPEPLLAEARAVLQALPEAPRYARIDGVRRDGHLLLMEAELIEPYLYSPAAPEVLDRYVHVISRRAA